MLPKRIQDALDDYDRRVASGGLTFDHGEFADMPSVDPGDWLGSLVRSHLPAMDLAPNTDHPVDTRYYGVTGPEDGHTSDPLGRRLS